MLRWEVKANRAIYAHTQSIRLPALIRGPEDTQHFFLEGTDPNYVTKGRVTAPVVCEGDLLSEDIAGKIVMLRSADPGYDWIFSRAIKGFITEYGGMNSHMAIRAAELCIPAVIGCGGELFQRWGGADRLEIDCPNQVVRVLA